MQYNVGGVKTSADQHKEIRSRPLYDPNEEENSVKCTCGIQGNALKDSGTRDSFDTGAVRDGQKGKGRMDLLPWRAIRELSKHFERGAEKYEARNWEKGIPLSRFVDSGTRHLAKFMCGETDEPHLVAACWNFMCLLDTSLRIKDGTLSSALHDIPSMQDFVTTYTDPDKVPKEPEELAAPVVGCYRKATEALEKATEILKEVEEWKRSNLEMDEGYPPIDGDAL